MYPHRIRLRGPWECQPRRPGESDGGTLPSHRVTMPCRWNDLGLGGFAGRVRFERRFGLPRQLDPHERVWLTITGAETVGAVRLNGHPADLAQQAEPIGRLEADVTDLLDSRNQLEVEVEARPDNGQPWEEVALEIRCTAFLREVRVWTEPANDQTHLRAAGEVAGTAEEMLELYLLLDNRTVAYAVVRAGHPFDVVSEPLAEGRLVAGATVRVELVCGAVVWYTVEQAVDAPR